MDHACLCRPTGSFQVRCCRHLVLLCLAGLAGLSTACTRQHDEPKQGDMSHCAARNSQRNGHLFLASSKNWCGPHVKCEEASSNNAHAKPISVEGVFGNMRCKHVVDYLVARTPLCNCSLTATSTEACVPSEQPYECTKATTATLAPLK